MIFEKAIYSTSNPLKSLQKRITLAFLKGKETFVFKDTVKTRVPLVKEALGHSHIEILNSHCHVKAFSIHNDKAVVNRFLCDSCGDCSRVRPFNIEMEEDSGSEELLLLRR